MLGTRTRHLVELTTQLKHKQSLIINKIATWDNWSGCLSRQCAKLTFYASSWKRRHADINTIAWISLTANNTIKSHHLEVFYYLMLIIFFPLSSPLLLIVSKRRKSTGWIQTWLKTVDILIDNEHNLVTYLCTGIGFNDVCLSNDRLVDNPHWFHFTLIRNHVKINILSLDYMCTTSLTTKLIMEAPTG